VRRFTSSHGHKVLSLSLFAGPGWLPTLLALVFLSLGSCARVAPPVVVHEPPPVVTPPPPEVAAPLLPRSPDPRLAPLDAIIRSEISAGHTPGAVVVVGHQGKIVYRRAFGSQALLPQTIPLTPEAIFDLASLTKVVATAPAILQLAEAGRLRLDDPVVKYWPEFASQGKRTITIRHLLTHTSGLRADVRGSGWSGYQGAMAALAADRPLHPPGTSFHYSDANFIALGEIVRRVSGQPLDAYCAAKLYRPLGMRHTRFCPTRAEVNRIAPTDVRWGEVHDPIAYRMGGVAGNAGVFSTADDLALFAQMFLDRGRGRNGQVLSAASVAAMTKPYAIPGNATRRGLGWDILSPYSRVFSDSFPAGSFGHTGYTGTSLWIDPRSRTFLIILTNRLHPRGNGNVKPLRARVAAAVAAALNLGPSRKVAAGQEPVMTGAGAADGPVRTGLEVLADQGFAPLQGKNIGVITNHSGRDRRGRSLIALLQQAPGVRLKAIFSPEHGLAGTLDQKVASGTDPATGLKVHSLYGEVKKPTPAMLRGLDALVYDLQDVGVRFYTYITTLGYCLEAAASAKLDFYVLDRPDPLTAAAVQGPVLEPALKSFIGYFPLPVRYGLTPGEVAGLFNRENRINAKLHVIKMAGYRRDMWLDQTGVAWVNPSPNLRSLTQTILYPAVGLVEAANVSVGRGTPTPFEVLGAPWISGKQLADHLNRRQIPGVSFEAVTFTPRGNRYARESCSGVRLRLTDRNALDSPALGLELAAALVRLHPDKFQLDRTLGMIGSRQILQALKRGDDPRALRPRWQPGLEAFQRLRTQYLLYQ